MEWAKTFSENMATSRPYKVIIQSGVGQEGARYHILEACPKNLYPQKLLFKNLNSTYS